MKCLTNSEENITSFSGAVAISVVHVRTTIHNEAYELHEKEKEFLPENFKGIRVSSGFYLDYYVETLDVFKPGDRIILRNPVLVRIMPKNLSLFRFMLNYFILRKYSLAESKARKIVGDILLKGENITFYG